MSNPKILAFSIVLFVAVLAANIIVDYNKERRGKTTKHRLDWLIRCALVIPSITGLTYVHPWPWYYIIGIVVGMLAFIWWLFFDGIRNLPWHQGFWYNGSNNDPTEKNNSWLDVILARLTDTQEALLKIGGSALFLFLYLLGYFI